MKPQRLLATTLCLILVSCAARQPGAPVKPGMNFFSAQQDVELGKQAAQEVLQQSDVVKDQFLQEYVRRIGRRLAETTPAKSSGFPFEFTVLNDKSLNAFALPGGPMFILAGLMASADTEGQLAGVMGHEMAHVILRHGTNQVSKATLLQIPAQVGGVMLGGDMLGQLAQLGIGFGLNSLLLKFSRGAETQADIVGTRIIAEAGYNPIEMARFFEKLAGEGGSRGPQFLASHPDPGNRVKTVEGEITAMPQQAYDFQTGDFERMKAGIAKLPAPNPPPQKQAAPPQQVNTGGQWRPVDGPGYRIAAPADWDVVQSPNSPNVVIAPRGGLARDISGNVSVGFGVLLGHYSPRSATDLGGASNELWRQMSRADPSLRVTGQARAVNVGGSRGMMAPYQTESPFGGTETGMLVTVARPEGLFYMVAAAPQQSDQQIRQMIEQVMGSVQFR